MRKKWQSLCSREFLENSNLRVFAFWMVRFLVVDILWLAWLEERQEDHVEAALQMIQREALHFSSATGSKF